MAFLVNICVESYGIGYRTIKNNKNEEIYDFNNY